MTRTKGSPNDPGRRERILDAALRLLCAEGAQAVTTRKVAAYCHVPVGSVSYYFTSVKQLLLEASELVAANRATSLERWVRDNRGEPLPQDLARLIHEQLTTGRDTTIAAYELYFLGLRDPDLRQAATDSISALARHLSARVNPTQAWSLAALVDGLQMHSLLLDQPPTVEDLANDLARHDCFNTRPSAAEQSSPEPECA